MIFKPIADHNQILLFHMNFSRTLLSWYDKNQRDLPWRHSDDPYKIWVSEIILQQTRIEQGTDYYIRFVERFPGVKELAEADEQDVLRLWQGLGYYSRARNLHQAAKAIIRDHHGVFPSEHEKILKLKGIGEYTAAAISSISFGLPYPSIDGNVLRFIARCFGIHDPVDSSRGKKQVLQIACKQITRSDPGKFNQAMMEFGALQCKPGVPDCSACPFKNSCYALTQGKVRELPAKSKSVIQRMRYFSYLVFIREDIKKGKILFLQKREGNDIWKNLYDFPLIESPKPLSLKVLKQSQKWLSLTANSEGSPIRVSKTYKHVLSHQLIYAKFYVIPTKRNPGKKYIPVSMNDLHKFPVPRLIEKFLSGYLPQ